VRPDFADGVDDGRAIKAALIVAFVILTLGVVLLTMSIITLNEANDFYRAYYVQDHPGPNPAFIRAGVNVSLPAP
jgi:hypothetical protein